MSIIRSMLLRKYSDAIETFGFVTSENRHHLGLEKTHYIDACVIASVGVEFVPSEVVYYKRRVSKGDYQPTINIKGKQKRHVGKWIFLGIKLISVLCLKDTKYLE